MHNLSFINRLDSSKLAVFNILLFEKRKRYIKPQSWIKRKKIIWSKILIKCVSLSFSRSKKKKNHALIKLTKTMLCYACWNNTQLCNFHKLLLY